MPLSMYIYIYVETIDVISYHTFKIISPRYMRNDGQKQVSRVGTNSYIPHILWDVFNAICLNANGRRIINHKSEANTSIFNTNINT